jgi:hypothetical protein
MSGEVERAGFRVQVPPQNSILGRPAHGITLEHLFDGCRFFPMLGVRHAQRLEHRIDRLQRRAVDRLASVLRLHHQQEVIDVRRLLLPGRPVDTVVHHTGRVS